MENKRMQKTNYSRSDLLRLEPLKLHEYLTDNFTITIPDRLDSVEEVSRTAELISRATAYYSFLESMRVEANLKKNNLQGFCCNHRRSRFKESLSKRICKYAKTRTDF